MLFGPDPEQDAKDAERRQRDERRQLRWAATRLAEHAEVIRALGKRASHDIIEIGWRLIECKRPCA
jgi:hypothetical protein